MMNVLFMIGRGQEEPSIIDRLLDVKTLQSRPDYDFAPGENLILSDCGFEDMKWRDGIYASYESYSLFKVSKTTLNPILFYRNNLKLRISSFV
jgi:tRNA pseudouridine38/39 synthase